jgi:hypothetical protein
VECEKCIDERKKRGGRGGKGGRGEEGKEKIKNLTGFEKPVRWNVKNALTNGKKGGKRGKRGKRK